MPERWKNLGGEDTRIGAITLPLLHRSLVRGVLAPTNFSRASAMRRISLFCPQTG
jgi:hypothetical protein